ncbi:MAG: aminomethyltransferase family protein, partial [Myxococcales bacterium]|nr:aminomethyltransferase family protein [Myxococcales bacterium]
VEAGFILQGCDYTAASDALIPSHLSSPYELNLGWTVKLDRAPFIGQRALRAEKERGPAWAFVGLDIAWEPLERLYAAHDLPPHLPLAAWRTPVPIYRGMRQIGRATSGAWSPTLKRNLALASVEAEFAAVGTVVDFEVTVEWERCRVPATVSALPFFDPPRKRA